jgi:HEPN domain-containing protein
MDGVPDMALRFETELWWEQAKRDLKIAEHNHASGDYEACVFFCEQAAQKALKALLMHTTEKPLPKIHNLVELGRLVGVDDEMSIFLGQLTPHYMIARYPDAAGAVTTELYDGWMSRRFLKGTKEVVAWCRKRLR